MSDPEIAARHIKNETVVMADGQLWQGVWFDRCHIVLMSDDEVRFIDCRFVGCTYELDGEHYDTDGFIDALRREKTMCVKAMSIQ